MISSIYRGGIYGVRTRRSLFKLLRDRQATTPSSLISHIYKNIYFISSYVSLQVLYDPTSIPYFGVSIPRPLIYEYFIISYHKIFLPSSRYLRCMRGTIPHSSDRQSDAISIYANTPYCVPSQGRTDTLSVKSRLLHPFELWVHYYFRSLKISIASSYERCS